MHPLTKFFARMVRRACRSHAAFLVRSALFYRPLRGLLSGEDAPDKRAAIIGESEDLADFLGLRSTARITLRYPEFTAENLALRDDAYDFVVSDQVVARCRDLADAASETTRILKPGGWFVHTAPLFARAADRESSCASRGFASLFPHATRLAAGGWAAGLAALLMAALSSAGRWKKRILQASADPQPVWPVASWVHGRKTSEPVALTATVHTRSARRRKYAYRPKEATFGVVACVKNEAPYLLEWIAHYRVLGFEQITIYDNESNDASFEILGPLSRAGVINAAYWRPPAAKSKQVTAYNNALRRLRDKWEWCLFADLDEYLLLDEGFSLQDLVRNDGTVTGIGIPWRIYGSGGKGHRETDLTIERFTTAAATNDFHVKSIVRLRDARFMNVHMPDVTSGRVVDLEGRSIPYECRGLLDRITDGPARINHYFCRSAEEFECKRARGRGALSAAQQEIRPRGIFKSMDRNEVEATDALRMVPAVKEEVARLRELIRK